MDETPKEEARASEKETNKLVLPLQYLIDLEHVWEPSKGSAEVWLELPRQLVLREKVRGVRRSWFVHRWLMLSVLFEIIHTWVSRDESVRFYHQEDRLLTSFILLMLVVLLEALCIHSTRSKQALNLQFSKSVWLKAELLCRTWRDITLGMVPLLFVMSLFTGLAESRFCADVILWLKFGRDGLMLLRTCSLLCYYFHIMCLNLAFKYRISFVIVSLFSLAIA